MERREMKVDPNRRIDKDLGIAGTGIYIRAMEPNGNWGTFDIYELDKFSLVTWLQSRGGDNKIAEDVVCVLLGHERDETETR